MAKHSEWSPAFVDGKPNQDSYAGFVDGEHWHTLLACFEDWVKRHHQPHAQLRAQQMADTANQISPDLVMAAFEIVDAEYDDRSEPWEIPFWQTFDRMCEQFASGYQPENANEFVKDLVGRLTGLSPGVASE
jgi:hypothetical protein